MSTIPKELPAGLEAYGRSPDFTQETLPASLQAAHATKAGTCALVHVLEGKLRYRLDPPHEGEVVAGAGQTVVIEPRMPHGVTFVEPGRIFVEFYRAKSAVG
jgi:hemoglobin